MYQRDRSAERGAGDSIQHHVLAHRQGRVDDPGAPEEIQQPGLPGKADLAEQPIQPQAGKDCKCDVQRRAGIGGSVHVLEERHRRVAAPVDAEIRCRGRPEQEDKETAPAEQERGEAIASHFAAVPQQRRPEGNVKPEREIERHRPRLERYKVVERRERHGEHLALRVVEYPEIGDEEAGDAERRGEHLAEPGGGHAVLQLRSPWRCRCRHCRLRHEAENQMSINVT